MNIPHAPWRAVLLAGGRSSRMGTDKALLTWGDRTLLDHMHALLRDAGADEVIVSGERPAQCGIPDARPGTGPMGALAQLAPHLCDGSWVIVPVDMPLLSKELLRRLSAVDAQCTCMEAHALPMALRLDSEVRAKLAEIGTLSGRACSLRALQQRMRSSVLPCAPWVEVLRNCNTPADWMELREWASSQARMRSRATGGDCHAIA